MNRLIKYALLPAMLLPLLVQAQVTVRATIDSSSILIGEQTRIRLVVSHDKNKPVLMPLYVDSIIKGVEIVRVSKPDTSEVDDRIIQITTDYQVTSFDAGLYYIPPFKLVSNTDTFRSNSLGLKVITLPVDTVKKQFYDIKPVLKPEWVLADYQWIILSVLLLLLAFFAGMYTYLRRKHNKPLFVRKPEPQLPPHIKAVNELEHIKQEKLWQQGREKDYYTRLTDVLRVYLQDRFGVNALEMTTSEIIAVMYSLPETQSVIAPMKQVLELSDFVKFAKLNPLPDENELSMMNALLIVNKTKVDEVVAEAAPVSAEAKKDSKL